MNFINEFVRQLSILRGEAKSERICFITAPVEDLTDLAKTVMNGHGLIGDIQKADRFHVTLAVFPDFPEEAIIDFLQISLPIKFSVSAARLGTFETAPTNPLVLLVDPDPALVRLQSDIYNLGIKLGLQLSDPDHFKASKWQPHITLAMNVEELPDSFNMIKPVKVGVDRFVLQRDGYDEIVEVNLPGSIGDRLLVTVRSKVQRTVQPEIVERITPETGIEVSHEEFMALMRGEQVIHGATRRVLTFDDGPFAVVRHGDHVEQEGEEGRRGGSQPGYTHDGGADGEGEQEQKELQEYEIARIRKAYTYSMSVEERLGGPDLDEIREKLGLEEDDDTTDEYPYQYFSPFRPLPFGAGELGIQIGDRIYRKEPMSLEDLVKYELVASNRTTTGAIAAEYYRRLYGENTKTFVFYEETDAGYKGIVVHPSVKYEKDKYPWQVTTWSENYFMGDHGAKSIDEALGEYVRQYRDPGPDLFEQIVTSEDFIRTSRESLEREREGFKRQQERESAENKSLAVRQEPSNEMSDEELLRRILNFLNGRDNEDTEEEKPTQSPEEIGEPSELFVAVGISEEGSYSILGPQEEQSVERHGKHVDQKGEEGRRGGSAKGYKHVADTPQGRRAAGKKIPVGEPIFHGTGADAAQSIMDSGLLIDFADENNTKDDVVFATNDRRTALLFASRSTEKTYAIITIDGSLAGSKPTKGLLGGELMFNQDIPAEAILKIDIYDRGYQQKDDKLIQTIERTFGEPTERARPASKRIKVEYKEKEFEFPEYFEGQEKVGHAAYGTQVFTPHLLGHVDTWEGSRQNAALQAYHRVVGAQKAKDENIHGFALSHGGNFVGVGALNFSPEDAPSEEDYMNIEALVISETGHSEAAMKEIIKKASEENRGIFMNAGSEAKAFLSGIGMREDGKGSYFLTPEDVTSLSSELKGPKDGEYISPSSKPRLRQRFGRMFEESEVTTPIDNRPPPMSREKQEWQARDKWDRFNWDAWKDPEMVWNPENQMAKGFQEQNESLFQDEVDEEAERGKLDIMGKIKEGGSSSMAFGRLGQSVSELFGGKPRESAKYLKDSKHYEKEYGEDIVWPEGRFEDDDESNERLLDFANQAEGVRDEDGEGNWHDSTEYIYNRTQQVLKEAGYETSDTVRLYRGIPTGNMPEEHDGGWVKLNLGSLSSWTFNRAIAGQAATRGGRGAMLRADIPVSRIYSMWATGPGSREAMEYLILGQDGIRAWATKISRK